MESEQSDLGYNSKRLRAIAQDFLEGSLISFSKMISEACSGKSELRGDQLRLFKNNFFSEYRNTFEILRNRGMLFDGFPIGLSLLPSDLERLSFDLTDSFECANAKVNLIPNGELAKSANHFSGMFVGDIKPDYVSDSRAMNKIMKINDLEKANDSYKSVRKDLESKGFDVSLFPESMYDFVKIGGHKE